jgi:hypothetical protein
MADATEIAPADDVAGSHHAAIRDAAEREPRKHRELLRYARDARILDAARSSLHPCHLRGARLLTKPGRFKCPP